MANVWYANTIEDIIRGDIDLVNDPIHVALMRADYAPTAPGQRIWDDVAEHEAEGPGYAAGGQALANRRVEYDTARGRTVLHADAVVWPRVTVAAGGAVLYKRAGSRAESRLVGFIDFGRGLSAELGRFVIDWHPAHGVAYVDAQLPAANPKKKARWWRRLFA